MSEAAYASDWPRLESSSFRFRDPQNQERRLIHLRLDNVEPPSYLREILYIDWSSGEYEKLKAATLPEDNRSVGRLDNDETNERSVRSFSLGHTHEIQTVSWSPDGKTLATGSDDRTVRLWDTETGSCLRVLKSHSGFITSVCWSPDGKSLASASYDKTVRVWDAESGSCLFILEDHSDYVSSVVWSHKGRLLASGSDDQTVRIWDANSGKCVRVITGHLDYVTSVSWSPDDTLLASGSFDKIRIWDIELGACRHVLEGHSGRVKTIDWNSYGHLLASGSDDRTVRLWDTESGSCIQILRGHAAPVKSVSWEQDGALLATGSDDSTARIWNPQSGNCLQVFIGHSDYVTSVAWSPDGNILASGSEDRTIRLWDPNSGDCLRIFEGHAGSVSSMSLSHDAKVIVSGSEDNTVRLWDSEVGAYLGVFEGHSDCVISVALSPDGKRLASGSDDLTIRLWDTEGRTCSHILKGHSGYVKSVDWNPNSKLLASGSYDSTVRIWDTQSGNCLLVIDGHTDYVTSIAWSPDGKLLASGSDDRTVRIWNPHSGHCLGIFEGHAGFVSSVVWSHDGKRLASNSYDATIRIWDLESGNCLRIFEGHSGFVNCVAWSPDDKYFVSGSDDATIRLWDIEFGACIYTFKSSYGFVTGVAWSSDGNQVYWASHNGLIRKLALDGLKEIPKPEGQVLYTNAKVLLVGESRAGKTGLSLVLSGQEWRPTDSSLGAWATLMQLPAGVKEGIEREVWLWDFGGQADQRLIHQLFMDETELVVLVFDGQKEETFDSVAQWIRDLTKATRRPFVKLLVAGRVDECRVRASIGDIEKFRKDQGFVEFFETSAKEGLSCEELNKAIVDHIPWNRLPCRSTQILFRELKKEIIKLKDEGRVLMRFNELRDVLALRMFEAHQTFSDDELRTVLKLLVGPCVIWELAFGDWVLLQPEKINAYGQVVIRTVQMDEHERGCIEEDRVLNGELEYPQSMERLSPEDERFTLLAMHEIFLKRGFCFRQHTSHGNLLIFPSYYRIDRPEGKQTPPNFVTYTFGGFIDEIYATLVVAIHHSDAFSHYGLWRDAADFKTQTGRLLGFRMVRNHKQSTLEVFSDPEVPLETNLLFSKLIHEHLMKHARDVQRLRHYICGNCGTSVGNGDVAMRRVQEWTSRSVRQNGVEKPRIICVECKKDINLWDDMEQIFASTEIQQRVREMQEESAIELDNESRERVLVGDVMSTVALAGQICFERSISDHGIDMEIVFKDDNHEATGQRLYLQLKSGDSFTYIRQRDQQEVFTIKKQRHVKFWMSQGAPVMLVIRNSEGEVRWMEISEYLRRESENGTKAVKQIIFKGERLNVMSVRQWRDKILGSPQN